MSQIELKSRKLIVAEGADAYFFCIWAYQGFGASGIQVLNSGGISELSNYLKTLKLTQGFDDVDGLLVVRDAELDALSAVASVRHSLNAAGLPVPDRVFEYADGYPRTAFALFPGVNPLSSTGTTLADGTLEDLCLLSVENDPIMRCVDAYIECIRSVGESITHEHKVRLHAYLSGKSRYTGMKIGLAAEAGAWNWSHECFADLRRVIITL